jgi:hypothetical protein
MKPWINKKLQEVSTVERKHGPQEKRGADQPSVAGPSITVGDGEERQHNISVSEPPCKMEEVGVGFYGENGRGEHANIMLVQISRDLSHFKTSLKCIV